MNVKKKPTSLLIKASKALLFTKINKNSKVSKLFATRCRLIPAIYDISIATSFDNMR
jgi:hypothetical protein